MFVNFLYLWSLQEPTKSAKSSTKNSNAGGGKDACTENSEEVKMTVFENDCSYCLCWHRKLLSIKFCSWAFLFFMVQLFQVPGNINYAM